MRTWQGGYSAMTHRFFAATPKRRRCDVLTQAAFDLETSSLNGDYGSLGVAVIHPAGEENPIVLRGDVLNKNWKTKRSDDSAIVKEVAEELSSYDILIAHNGAAGRFGFDIPFLQARLVRWGLPPFPRKKIIDPVQIARNQLRLSGHSLESIAGHLGLEQKMRLANSVWVEAFLDGTRAAMDLIVERCKSDVRILCEIVKSIKGYCHQL